MPSYSYLGSKQATARVLNLWNGSTNNSPPTGWETVGFNDSGWSLSSNPGSASNADYVSQGIDMVAPWTSPPNSHASMLVRFHFTGPSSPFVYYLHDWLHTANNLAGGTSMFVNGHQLQGRQLVGTNGPFFNLGADNVVAIFLDLSPTATTWGSLVSGIAFRAVFYTPDTGGSVHSWGTVTTGVNDKGVLGVGDTSTHLTPTALNTSSMGSDGAQIVKVASNGKTTLLLTATGTLYGCGDNSTGLLGTGSTDATAHTSPSVIGGVGSYVADVSIGGDCAIAMTRWGDAYMWGPNASGSLGRGNTTAQLSPQIQISGATSTFSACDRFTIPFNAQRLSAGKNFSAVYDPTSTRIQTAGDNTYGQLGQGTSGGSVTTRAAVQVVTGSSIDGAILKVSAGEDQLVFIEGATSVHTARVWCCGRAEYGSLGISAYTAGTGVNHIVNQAMLMGTGINQVGDAQQAGPLTFILDTDPGVGQTSAWGDGTPFGGSGDDGFDPTTFTYGNSPPTTVYGTTAGSHGVGLPAVPHGTGALNLWPLAGLAYSGAGSQNAYAAGNSKAVFAAFSFNSDGKLYTWGWGGAGQMGSGADATTNIAPISVNGLTNVIGACVAAAIVFAISSAPAAARAGRVFAAVIG